MCVKGFAWFIIENTSNLEASKIPGPGKEVETLVENDSRTWKSITVSWVYWNWVQFTKGVTNKVLTQDGQLTK